MQGVQNCTSLLSYGCFAYKQPQTSLLSSKEQQLCPFCVDTIEDECHVLFTCPVYDQLRDKFPLPLYRGVPEKEHYCRLCSDSDDKTVLNMS